MDGRRFLVTGSSGCLGATLVRRCRELGHDVVGLDQVPSPFTTVDGSVVDHGLLRRAMVGVDVVLHTAALHQPHIASHGQQAFIDTNVSGTLALLEEAVAAGVRSFVLTSSTSVFGRALAAKPGAPANWISEEVEPTPRNIYGVTKLSAENLCELVSRESGLPVVVLRTARFFPGPDDLDPLRRDYEDENLKVNEFLNRRVDIEDAVSAHVLGAERAWTLGFARYVISAPTPFTREDAALLGSDARMVVERLYPDQVAAYARRGWSMFPTLDRVYDSSKARAELGWSPTHSFRYVLDRLEAGEKPYNSPPSW